VIPFSPAYPRRETMSEERAARGTKMIFRRKRPDGTLYDGWYVRWTDGVGKRCLAFGGRTQTSAAAFLRKKHDERDNVRIRGERPVQKQSLTDFLPTLENRWKATAAKNTFNGRIGLVRKTAKHFGTKAMAQITQADLHAWLTELKHKENLKASTIRHAATTLSAVFRLAVEMGRAYANPAKGMRLPKPDEQPIPRLTGDEIARIYAAMPANVKAYVILLGETGTRRNEALHLTWSDVEDFQRIVIKNAKHHRTRVVSLTPRAQQVVHELWDSRPATPLNEPARLFPSLSSTRVNTEFRKAADKAGFPHVTPHTLRHAVGTQLAEAGVPTRDIRDVLGHSSIKITERYMNRAPQTAIDQAMQKLATARGADQPNAATSAG
jgi:integrase